MALIKQVSKFEIEVMGDLYYGQIQKAYMYVYKKYFNNVTKSNLNINL